MSRLTLSSLSEAKKLLFLPFGLTIIMLTGFIWYVRESYQTLKHIQDQELKIQELSGEIIYYDEVLTMSARMNAATGNSQWETRYRQFVPLLDQAIADSQLLIPEAYEGVNAAETDAANDRLVAIEERSFELVRQDQAPQAQRLLSSEEYEKQKQLYAAGVEAITEKMQEMVENSINSQVQKAWLTILIFGGIFVLLLFVWILVLRILMRSTQAIHKSTQILSEITSQITETIQDQDRLAQTLSETQVVAMNETTTTMDQLANSARQFAEQVDMALLDSKQAFDLTDEGMKVVNRMARIGDELKEQVDIITEQMSELTQQTNQIGTISKLVGNIANQTNMLALNASLEAVRAGEAGTGFTVVSLEIRELANQSQASARKIANLVQEIQTAIKTTAQTTHKETQTVNESISLMVGTKQVFHQVASSMNNITNNSQNISSTTREQVGAIQQIVERMKALTHEIQHITKITNQTKQMTQQLNEATFTLESLVK